MVVRVGEEQGCWAMCDSSRAEARERLPRRDLDLRRKKPGLTAEMAAHLRPVGALYPGRDRTPRGETAPGGWVQSGLRRAINTYVADL